MLSENMNKKDDADRITEMLWNMIWKAYEFGRVQEREKIEKERGSV